jgi:hypothetical protein
MTTNQMNSPLKPPLAQPNRPLRDEHLSPQPRPVVDPTKLPLFRSKPAIEEKTTERARESRPLFCRECGLAMSWRCPGSYLLRRKILKKSIPPEILNEAQRARWAKDKEQWMGVYCSLECLEKSLPRLKRLDRELREKGVGTRLVADVAPVAR